MRAYGCKHLNSGTGMVEQAYNRSFRRTVAAALNDWSGRMASDIIVGLPSSVQHACQWWDPLLQLVARHQNISPGS
jgi:hypothetical protein